MDLDHLGSKRKNDRTKLTLTGNDVKILGTLLEKRREKSLPPTQFQTKLFKTQNSNWTPVLHKPSNDQIFNERKALIINWFDLWSGSQRRQFFNLVLLHCTNRQLAYIQNWFNERVPLRHIDFTTILPKFLSLYVFSFLDPRSLSRASMVSSHWKFLLEQDVLWMPKCLRHGWFLPYTPSLYEFGAWKRHYLACLQSLNDDDDDDDDEPGNLTFQTQLELHEKSSKSLKSVKNISRRKALRLLLPHLGREILEARPPWFPPDRNPRDLDEARNAALAGFNPNDPKIHPSLLLYHNKFGGWKSQLRQSAPAIIRSRLEESSRRSQHHLIRSDNLDHQLKHDSEGAIVVTTPLSKSLLLENFEERRFMEICGIKSDPPKPKKNHHFQRRKDLSGGGEYPIEWKKQLSINSKNKKFELEENPHVLLISSKVSAAEMLIDAVMFKVITICYDFEATTLDSLLYQLDSSLQGRQAKSIGIFVDSDKPDEIRLTRDAIVNYGNCKKPSNFLHFFKTFATYVLPVSNGGHIDLFTPLCSSESGLKLISYLTRSCRMAFCAPSGVTGKYNHINSEWLLTPEGILPSCCYFSLNKLNIWLNVCEHVNEACRVSTKLVSKYFDRNCRDVVSKVVGQVIFKATGFVRINNIEMICKALIDGLIHIGQERNENGLLGLSKYLEDLGRKENEHLKMKSRFNLDDDEDDDDDDEDAFDESNAKLLSHHFKQQDGDKKTTEDEELMEMYSENEFEQQDNEGDNDEGDKNEVVKNKGDNDEKDKEERDGDREKREMTSQNNMNTTAKRQTTLKNKKSTLGPTFSVSFGRNPDLIKSSSSFINNDSMSMTFYGNSGDSGVDRRTLTATEILSSELDYMRTLEMIEKIFFLPCEAALASNRAIISTQNLQIIFKDLLLLLQLSGGLVSDLQLQLSNWSSQQCLGNVFIKFNSKIKSYINFLKSYPVVLRTIEKCTEQTPLFRSFLKRHERTAATKMLTLPELLLIPFERIHEYTILLKSFQNETPDDHPDRSDLSNAIKTFNDLNQLVQQAKLKLNREEKLLAIQKEIIKCPILLEANRFFVKRMDVSGLRSPSDLVIPELRVYHHVDDLCLVLFNDSLLVTRRTTKHVPFERRIERSYVFVECSSLTRLRVEDLPDSKYVRNAFRMFTPKREWFCCVELIEDKQDWINTLEKAIRSSLEESD